MGGQIGLQFYKVMKMNENLIVPIKIPFRFVRYTGIVNVVEEELLYNVC
jgi:hypothetical protein